MPPRKRKKIEDESEESEPESEESEEEDPEGDYGLDDEDDRPAEKKRRVSEDAKAAVSKGTSSRPKRKASEKAGQEEECVTVDSVIIVDPSELKGSQKIAAFELEFTLVKPKGKAKTARNREDWTWCFDEIPDKLKKLHADGYKIVIFTNQPKIMKHAVRSTDITGKILDMSIDVSVPIQAFIASDDDLYKKPFTKMWDLMVANFNGGIAPELASCIFVGNNGGRDKDWKKGAAKDSNAADRKFAANIGISFKTPEEYFLGEPAAAFEWRSVDPRTIKGEKLPFTPEEFIKDKKGKQELVLMVGMPASGKSTYAKALINADYANVNQDTLKSKAKCLKVLREKFAAGKDVVVDNTFASKAARKEYIDIAKEKGITVRCIHFTTPEEVCHHLNAFRERVTDARFAKVPFLVFNKYKKDFEEPDLSEGFEEIRKTHFVPHFEDPQKEKLFLSWY